MITCYRVGGTLPVFSYLPHKLHSFAVKYVHRYHMFDHALFQRSSLGSPLISYVSFSAGLYSLVSNMGVCLPLLLLYWWEELLKLTLVDGCQLINIRQCLFDVIQCLFIVALFLLLFSAKFSPFPLAQ